MSRIKGRVWPRRLLTSAAILVAVVACLLAYLSTPVPPVDLPGEKQPPLPRPLPHSLHSLPYAASEWPSVHGGPANNDYVAIAHGVEFAKEWQALQGMATVVAPTTGPQGTLYQTAGNPPGGSNLYALDRRGNILWQTPPWHGRDDFDSCAVLNGAIIDSEGDLYVADCNQFWAFKPDGQVKWVIDLTAPATGAAYQDIDEELEIFDDEKASK